MTSIRLTDEPILARAVSFLWWKRVYIGSRFIKLPRDQKEAILSHERGHCDLHHTEVRLFVALFLPFLFPYICRKQELAADRYAARSGHAKALAKLLSSDYDGGFLQPSHSERRAQLKKYDHPRVAPDTSNFARTA